MKKVTVDELMLSLYDVMDAHGEELAYRTKGGAIGVLTGTRAPDRSIRWEIRTIKLSELQKCDIRDVESAIAEGLVPVIVLGSDAIRVVGMERNLDAKSWPLPSN